LLTLSAGAVAGEERLSAVPLVFVSEETLIALLDLPRIKDPPVAATAVPDIATNSANTEITVGAVGRPKRRNGFTMRSFNVVA